MLPIINNKDRILVSIVVPCYNGEKTLAETLGSVSSQVYDNWECLIIDDGSTDATGEIAAQFCREDHRFSVIKKQNGGLASARNAGIKGSRGELIAFLDSDDKWHPEKLNRHVNHLRMKPDVGVSYSWTWFINQNGTFSYHYRTPRVKNLSAYYIFCRNPITNGSNGIFRKEIFQFNKFDEGLSHNQDVDCWLRIAFGSPQRWIFEGIPAFLTYYRISKGGLSNDYQAHYACAQKVWDRSETYNPDVSMRYRKTADAFQLRFYSRRAIASRNYELARFYIRKALHVAPSIVVREPFSTFVTLLAAHLPIPKTGKD
jgi:glycosyltransferase involved in cell wall biosynthesis